MRFERLRLSNFKCYEDADVRLDRGVTVIFGLNGSGKSSLLEACFFALYGATALDRTLDEVVTIGADDAEVDLWFDHEGRSYHLHRRLRVGEDRATTADCVLETPDDTIEGVGDVEAYVEQLLRMDDDAFRNCAYVRQGEVNKLIDASPDERQAMIDDLLQLGTLKTYRERAVSARRAVQSLLGGQADVRSDLDAQIAEKEDADLHDRLNALRTELNEVDETRARYETNREEARETLAEAEAVLDEIETQQDELDELDEVIDELTTDIAETEAERESLAETVEDRRETMASRRERVANLLAETDLDEADSEVVGSRRADLDDEREAVREAIQEHRLEVQETVSTARGDRERADDLEDRAAELSDRADELDAEADAAAEELEDTRARLEALDDAITDKHATLDDADLDEPAESRRDALRADLESLRERETDARAALETARERVDEAETLLDAGKCPECGQSVEDSPHVDAIDERRERVADLETDLHELNERKAEVRDRLERAEGLVELEARLEADESNRDSVRRLLDERERSVSEKREEAASLREEAEDLKARAAEAEEAASEAEERAETTRAEVGELNARATTLADRIDRLDELTAALDVVEDLEDEIARLGREREHLSERNDDRRERLADRRERRRELREAYDRDRVEAARAERDRAETYLEKVEAELAALDERRDELVAAIGSVEAAIEELERLRERRAAVDEKVERLESLRDEAESLETAYGDLRAELRRRNVRRLEHLLNDTFDLVYGNDSYTHIELSDSYELTVYQKDGRPLDPEQLSGGERALFNLSLRGAVYRLLAEGIEGAAPMPPLVLDEPTVYLDSGHVSRLVGLVEAMRDNVGVEQVVVVSHDDDLVGAADGVIRVEKDATTNRSRIEHRPALV